MKNRSHTQIRNIIERYAVKNNLTFFVAARKICEMPEYWQLAIEAQGGWYKGKPPTVDMIRSWRNQKKVELVKTFDPEVDDPTGLEAYLPLYMRTDNSAAKRRHVMRLYAKGVSIPDCAKIAKVHLKTARRWLRLSL